MSCMCPAAPGPAGDCFLTASSLPESVSLCLVDWFGDKGRFYVIAAFISTKKRSVALEPFLTLPPCVSPADQRVASFCTLTDMRHAPGLEGAQELSLCVDPGSGKDFLDPAGYVNPVGPLLPLPRAPGETGISSLQTARRPWPRGHQNPEKGQGGTSPLWPRWSRQGIAAQPLCPVGGPCPPGCTGHAMVCGILTRGMVWAWGPPLPPNYCDRPGQGHLTDEPSTCQPVCQGHVSTLLLDPASHLSLRVAFHCSSTVLYHSFLIPASM